MEIVEIIGKGLLAAHIHKCLTEKEFVKALDRFQNKVLSNRKYLKRLEKKDIKTDKKANAEYWDEIDDVCAKAAKEILYKLADYSEDEPGAIDENVLDLGIDIRELAVKILEQNCGASFPYVDEDM